MTKRLGSAANRAPDLRFNLSGIVAYPPGARLTSRELYDYEMVWFLEGKSVWEHDGVEESVDPSSVILSRPGTIESYTWDPKHRTQHGFFHFDIRKRIPELPPPAQWPLVRRVENGDALRPLLHHIAWLLNSRPPMWRVAASSALRHALLMFVYDLTRSAANPSPTEHPVLERALAYLERAWSDRYRSVGLAELARHAGASPTHMSRLFRTEFGMSPGRAMRALRLQRSAALLCRTSLPIQTIAEMVGFSTPFHYSDTFRRSFGLSPRAYRTRALSGHPLPMVWFGRLQTFQP